MKNTMLVICDPQIDLVFAPGYIGEVAVSGAEKMLKKTASLVDAKGYGSNSLTGITVILNTKRVISITHTNFWINSQGENPPPYTIITHKDLVDQKWLPREHHARPPVLGGQNLLEHCLSYTSALERKGRFPLMVLPPNCLLGQRGHNVYPELALALRYWEEDEFASIDYLFKTQNHFVEQIGAVRAEFMLKNDKSTGVDTEFLKTINDADIVGFAGLWLSHGIRHTIDQCIKYLPNLNLSKIHILEDCTMSMPKTGGMDFPAITAKWLASVQELGVKVISSENFMND